MAMQPLHPEFQGCIDRQPYLVTLDGMALIVDKDVFPPDLGKCAQNLARMAARFRPQTALDMGCGTGYLALMLERQLVPEIWAVDCHAPAVACARKNVQRNARTTAITVIQSDLFDQIPPSVKFDLIVFNQPFGPGEGEVVCGCGPDGGTTICRRFLLAAPGHLTATGVVLMPFSDRVPPEHSPQQVAMQLGYRSTTLLHEYYSESNNFIYEIRPR
jgi:release factor glutamine methyltransferase